MGGAPIMTMEQALSGYVDRYISWSDEHRASGNLDPNQLESDENLIDPPEMAGGGDHLP